MKIFLGLESCTYHRFTHQPIRDTWLKDCPVDYKFFLAVPVPDIQADELLLPDAHDGQHYLLEKFSKEIDYVIEKEYDYFFRCHVDTYVHIPRLLASGFEGRDYIGFPQGGEGVWEGEPVPLLCYGGSGFWLSRPAMLCLQTALHTPAYIALFGHRIEDWEIGRILQKGGFTRTSDFRYRDRRPGPGPDNDAITFHEALIDLKDPHNLREYKYLMEAHEEAKKI